MALRQAALPPRTALGGGARGQLERLAVAVHPVEMLVEFDLGDSWERGVTGEISRSGMFVRSPRIPNVGPAVNLTVHLPGGRELLLKGRVVSASDDLAQPADPAVAEGEEGGVTHRRLIQLSKSKPRCTSVIASAAKQSSVREATRKMDCFVARAPRNDGTCIVVLAACCARGLPEIIAILSNSGHGECRAPNASAAWCALG